LDHIWAATVPLRLFYYILRAPGVIVHECAHIAGCLLTGAKIKNVVLFSREGGSVTYSQPVIPYLGDVIISTAPLFALPFLLSVITTVFQDYLGCTFPVFPSTISSPDMLLALTAGILSTIQANLLTTFNGWFLLYLYLTISLVLSAAPSTQDMKNAAIGIFLLSLFAAMILYSNIPFIVDLFAQAMRLLEIGFTLGLVYGLFALILSTPLILWYVYRRVS
ncbi:MAG: hypothetical protein GYA23_07620, partial [Methanomicrobiales archaeon]|nr:hypothetical protein [Methanomicrobiales archaeon]